MTNEIMAIDKVRELSVIVSQSRIISNWYKNPNDAFVALMMGQELGLKPIQSLNTINVIDGKPSLNADMMLGLAKQHPQYGGCEIGITDERCVVILKRKLGNDIVESVRSEFSMKDAETAGLLSKTNWKKYPKRMLKARAISFAVRDLFPDIFSGIYDPDEIQQEGREETKSKREIKGEEEVKEKKESKTNKEMGKRFEREEISDAEIITDGIDWDGIIDNLSETHWGAENGKAPIIEIKISDLVSDLKKAINSGGIHPSEYKVFEKKLKGCKDDKGNFSLKEIELLHSLIKSRIPENYGKKSPNKHDETEIIENLHTAIINGLNNLEWDIQHAGNSIQKHLGVNAVNKCQDVHKLQAYLTHLRSEWIKQKQRANDKAI